MRLLPGVLVLLVAGSAKAAPPPGLGGDVTYAFSDKNGVGAVGSSGTMTIMLTFTGKAGSLRITGTRQWRSGVFVAGKTPGGPPDVESSGWKGAVDETYPLHDVAVVGITLTFKLVPSHDHLPGSCAS